EVILNVRDMQVVEITDRGTAKTLYFDSHSDDTDLPQDAVNVIIDLEAIEFPKTTIGPEVSRVDGNHRLDGPDRYLESVAMEDTDEKIVFPEIPFMLFLD